MVYPNPASEQIVIDAVNVINWLCYDATGKLMATGSAEKQTIVDVSSWKSGIYFLHLISEEGTNTIRKIAVD